MKAPRIDVASGAGAGAKVAVKALPFGTGLHVPQTLTERELQVVTLAAEGQHNKLIAYRLGIAHSTVRVLMARAARKLDAHSREELLRRYAADTESRLKAASCCDLTAGSPCTLSAEFTCTAARKLVAS